MKKLASRLVAAALVVLFLTAIILPMTAQAASEIIGDGQMGDNVWWSLTFDGELTISGTGATWDYENPWYTGVWEEKEPGYRNDWKRVPVPGRGYVYPKTIKILDGVTTIGECILADMSELASVEVPKSVTKIKANAFWFCNALEDVYYAGSETQWKKIELGLNSEFLTNARIHYNCSMSDELSTWAKTEVSAAIDAGLVPKNLQQNYQIPVSRGEVAKMFVNLLEQSSGKKIVAIMAERNTMPRSGVFTDTSDEDVLDVSALGIINGTGDGKFSPDETLTRAQIAAIINRTANVMGVETNGYTHNFTDVAGHWADAELGWPAAMGIINGVGNNKFDPNAELTTEQAIVITYRALNVLKG